MNKKKLKKLKEVLPIFWNSYQHMYDVRERKAKGMIDFLLVISTFLPILSVTLYTANLFNNLLILLPIIPQLISIIILLKYFVVSTPAVHWIKVDKDLLNSLDSENFEIDTISTLKRLEEITGISMNEENRLIKVSRSLVLISLFILVLSSIFIVFNGNLYLYFFSLLLVLSFFYILFIYYKKKPDFSNADKIEEETKFLIKDWLNK